MGLAVVDEELLGSWWEEWGVMKLLVGRLWRDGVWMNCGVGAWSSNERREGLKQKLKLELEAKMENDTEKKTEDNGQSRYNREKLPMYMIIRPNARQAGISIL